MPKWVEAHLAECIKAINSALSGQKYGRFRFGIDELTSSP